MKHAFALLLLCLSSCSNQVHCTKGQPQPLCHAAGAATWPSSDGKTNLPVMHKLPPTGTRVKGAVILVTGLDGTLCDYQSLTQALVHHGYAVHGYEQRTMRFDKQEKHGRACNAKLWVEDLQKFTREVRALHPQEPLYYHAHSFGAVVAFETIAESRRDPAHRTPVPDGVIAQSPAFALLPESSPWLTNAVLWPFGFVRIPLASTMESKGLKFTRDDAFNCSWMRSENRVKDGYTLNWFRHTFSLGHKAREFSETDGMPPTLALWGGQDFITLAGKPGDFMAKNPEDYKEYIESRLAAGKARRKFYEKGCHLLTEGPGKEAVIRDILTWLDAKH